MKYIMHKARVFFAAMTVALTGSAAQTTIDGVTWNYDIIDGVCVIVKGENQPAVAGTGEVVVPQKLGGFAVSRIGWYAFKDCTEITKVTIPPTVTSIGGHAFEGCIGLESVAIPYTVTKVEEYAFDGCSALVEASLPYGTAEIGDYLFRNCTSLKYAFLPISFIDGVDGTVFDGAAPDLVVWYCGESEVGGLTWGYRVRRLPGMGGKIHAELGGNRRYVSAVLPVSVPAGCTLEIPEAIDGYVISGIGSDAFRYCGNMSGVEIPSTVTSIGEDAFYYCRGLQSVAVPDSVKVIGEGAFEACDKMTGVTLGSGIVDLGAHVFSRCDKLESVSIPDGVTNIADMAFYNCPSLKKVDVPGRFDGRIVPAHVFVEVPEHFRLVYRQVDHDATWYYYVDASGCAHVWNDVEAAFAPAGFLGGAAVPANLGGHSVNAIGSYAFRDCASITNVVIPSGVTAVDDFAFSGCASLESAVYLGDMPASGLRLYSGAADDLVSLVPAGNSTWAEALESGKWRNRAIRALQPSSSTKTLVHGEYCENSLAELGYAEPSEGGPYTFSVKGLPAGLKFTAKDIAATAKQPAVAVNSVYGTPTKPGIYEVTVTAKSAANKKGVEGKVTVRIANITDAEIPVADIYGTYIPGVEYQIALGGAAGCSVSGLPSGMKWTAKDIVDSKTKAVMVPANSVYGAATKPGNYTVYFTKTANKAKRTATATFKVGPYPVLAIETTGNGTGKVTGAGGYAAHKKVTLSARADKNSVFGGWYYGDELLSMASSYQFEMTESDVTLTARFVTLEEDRDGLYAVLDESFLFEAATPSWSTAVEAGLYLEWPLAVVAESLATVSVSGLPAGLKFTAKDIMKKGSKTEVEVPANTIYGAPTAASRIDKATGKPVPSKVKITITTAGRTKLEGYLMLAVTSLPEWVVGTFNGGGSDGQATLTVSSAGKISGKFLSGGQTWTLSAARLDEFHDLDSTYEATLTATAGRLTRKFSVMFDLLDEEERGGIMYVHESGVGEVFRAYQNNWGREPWKSIAKQFEGQTFSCEVGDLDENDGEMSLRFLASGKVAVKGSFVTGKDARGKDIVYPVSGSTVLAGPSIEQGDDDAVRVWTFVYFPPKPGKFAGYGNEWCMEWNGWEFERIE